MNLKFLFMEVIAFSIYLNPIHYIIADLVGPHLGLVDVVTLLLEMLSYHPVHLLLHQGADVVENCLIRLSHYQLSFINIMKNNIKEDTEWSWRTTAGNCCPTALGCFSSSHATAHSFLASIAPSTNSAAICSGPPGPSESNRPRTLSAPSPRKSFYFCFCFPAEEYCSGLSSFWSRGSLLSLTLATRFYISLYRSCQCWRTRNCSWASSSWWRRKSWWRFCSPLKINSSSWMRSRRC